ncbi:MAG: NUDIX hydrolase [Opitutaceae bacterium]
MNSGANPSPTGRSARVLLDEYLAATDDPAIRRVIVNTRSFIDAHDDCLLRTCREGHLTGSAWVVNHTRTHTLLTHHRKLGKWLQLGGHADGEADLAAVALREAAEESGLRRLALVSPQLFDLDQHLIPARRNESEHWHFDFRFLVEADKEEPLVVSDESHDLSWVPLNAVATLNPEPSLLRMTLKSSGFLRCGLG